MSGAFAAGLVAGYGVAIPVGAIGALLVGLTARTSLKVGAAAALGVATADGLYALAAVLGGAALGRLIEPIETEMRWASAIILIGLAVRTAVAAFRQKSTVDKNPTTPVRAYFTLLGLTVLNPATIVYFGAIVIGGTAGTASGLGTGMVFVVAAFLASASWQLLLAGGGSVVGHFLSGPRGQLVTALVSSVVIAVLAVTLVT
ncbi:LysE/ArgO family amino acid transporter [Actinocrispum wychmicini]|uniref:Arginine exporter protein ArgO n=1 Tax=Actinocrispum wychmicini TaxID=1213861 RepID=A0A4R2IMA7_9PSEU|nr:LysE family transporter [Actinocrispum wychmicini]TCO45837.1 arginine exporter protein ArgO [Actinocrispum wychmicini]